MKKDGREVVPAVPCRLSHVTSCEEVVIVIIGKRIVYADGSAQRLPVRSLHHDIEAASDRKSVV